MSKKLLDTLQYLSADNIASAVLAIAKENRLDGGVFNGFPVAAEEWWTHSKLRRDLFERIQFAWCRVTKKDFTWFPYSEDYVIKLYMRLSRAGPKTRKRWISELEEAHNAAGE